MYKEIEELEQRLGRSPAAIDMQDIDVDGVLKDPNMPKVQPSAKQLLPVPASSIPNPYRRSIPASQYSSQSVVGGRAPDYSGYDDLLKKLEGMKPRDTSTQDLINMGISTGVGLLFGRPAVGAKIAGEYGLDRYNKAESKSDQLEQMILKLQADRAARMATGQKGTKVSSGGSNNWRGQVRPGPDGGLYWMTNVDPDTGKFVPSEDDQRIDKVTAKIQNLSQPDGSTRQVAMGGNLLADVSQGYNPESKSVEEDAEGRKSLIGHTTGKQTPIGPNTDFNLSSLGMSKSDTKRYESLEDSFTKSSKAFSQANIQSTSGITSLANNDNASAMLALKEALRAAEGGKVSDADFSIMRGGLGPSWEERIDGWLGRVRRGETLSDVERKELRNMLVHIKNTSQKGQERNISTHNGMANKFLETYPESVRSRLQFRNNWDKYDAATQRKEANENILERNSYQFENAELARDRQGRLWKGYWGTNGKFVKTEEVTQ